MSKIHVFNPFKQGGQEQVETVPNCGKTILKVIMHGHAAPQAIMQSDGWRGSDGLNQVGYDEYVRA